MIKTGMGIFKVRYNDNEQRDYITHLQAGRVDSEDGKNIKGSIATYAWTKEQIVFMVTDTPGKTNVFTVIEGENGFEIGDEVEAYSEGDNTYLRTKGNSRKEDNLGNLDTF